MTASSQKRQATAHLQGYHLSLLQELRVAATREAGLQSCVGSLRLKVRPYDHRLHTCYHHHRRPDCPWV